MGIFHETLSDASKEIEHGEYDKAKAIIENHINKEKWEQTDINMFAINLEDYKKQLSIVLKRLEELNDPSFRAEIQGDPSEQFIKEMLDALTSAKENINTMYKLLPKLTRDLKLEK